MTTTPIAPMPTKLPPVAPASPPAAPPALATLTATPANVQTQLALAAKGGVSTIVLTGTFVRIAVNGLHPPQMVTLDCTNAVFVGSGTEFLTSSNWKVVGGDWSGSVYSVFNVQNSTNLEFDSLWVHDWAIGAPATATTAAIAQGGGAAFGLKNCQNVYIHDCRIAHSQGDGIDLVACQNIQIKRNRFWDMTYVSNHTDAIQFWNLAGFALTSFITIWDNVIIGHMQCIGMYSTSAAEPPGMDHMDIQRNIVATTLSWAGAFLNCTNSIMKDNFAMTLLGETHGWVPPSWYMTDGPLVTSPDSGKTNVISNNVNGDKP